MRLRLGPLRRADPQVEAGEGALEASLADAAERAAALAPVAADLRDADVTDLLLTDGVWWVDRGSRLERSRYAAPLAPDEALRVARDLIAAGGRHLDESTPFADVRLEGGLRVHAVIPPVCAGGATVAIRVHRRAPWRLDDLTTGGGATTAQAALLRKLVRDRRSLLVSGGTGAGKTSLLAALLAEAGASERIVVVEDVAELRIAHPHVVALEARQPNIDGHGGVHLDRLVREALRMRPDRLVVGEVRGAEIRDLLAALNTGHSGAGTVHANGLGQVPARLEALGALAGLDAHALARQVDGAVDAVIHLTRRDGRRVVEGIGRPVLDAAGRIAIVPC